CQQHSNRPQLTF
nr:immunoglobulin light chain junction region [Macaca mulatta]MPN96886.1 immunoglobulin light chain junction region [Macaca mulatta]MPN99220.1 immunoglobulin light chain junction region [Macaca mulatta]MPN99232.1 immunoglobulin light chain junction region [Macaca mulatta]MPO00508.1 immunoglobulin light chain junction region [Macaca mulatta]